MIRNKTIKFDMDKPDDRKLWEYLAKLPHGEFTETVKDYYRGQMYDRVTFNEPKKELSGPAIRYNDPVVQEVLKEAAERIREVWEAPLPDDHPIRKMFEKK